MQWYMTLSIFGICLSVVVTVCKCLIQMDSQTKENNDISLFAL